METQDVNIPKLLNQKAVAELVGKSEAWLERSRWSGIGGPPYRKIGRSVRYELLEVIEWLEAQPSISCTSELQKEKGGRSGTTSSVWHKRFRR